MTEGSIAVLRILSWVFWAGGAIGLASIACRIWHPIREKQRIWVSVRLVGTGVVLLMAGYFLGMVAYWESGLLTKQLP